MLVALRPGHVRLQRWVREDCYGLDYLASSCARRSSHRAR